ncbi:branched-chain amino acid transport system II carrier protein, partial [Staphylococcus saprophyticus]
DFNLFQPLISLYKVLPLSDIQLSWLLPFIILLFIGLIIDYFLKNKTVSTS